MNTTFTWQDLLSVAVASAVTAVFVTYTIVGDDTVVETVTVTDKVTPKACERALTQADRITGDAATVIDTANNVPALLQDVYAAGAAGASIAPTVRGWAQDLREANRDAATVTDTFDLNSQLCLAEVP